MKVEKPVPRDGLFGSLLDKILGKRKKKRTVSRQHHGMNIKTFLAYLELMNIDHEKRKKKQKRAKMKSKMKRQKM